MHSKKVEHANSLVSHGNLWHKVEGEDANGGCERGRERSVQSSAACEDVAKILYRRVNRFFHFTHARVFSRDVRANVKVRMIFTVRLIEGHELKKQSPACLRGREGEM